MFAKNTFNYEYVEKNDGLLAMYGVLSLDWSNTSGANDDWKFWLGDEATASTVGFDDAAFLSSDEENTEVAYEPQKHKNIRGREYYLKKLQHTNITSYKACQERAIALTIL